MESNILSGIIKQFEYYKMLGDKTFSQLPDEALFRQYNNESNSIAVIVKHLWGNMLSRWTDFLTTDGEKPWRMRDEEFENDIADRQEMISKWNEGWNCLFNAIRALTPDDMDKIIYIRNQGHTVTGALYRQLAHYSYHIGQIVYIGKLNAAEWSSLSIPRGKSSSFNDSSFTKDKRIEHFTDDHLKKER